MKNSKNARGPLNVQLGVSRRTAIGMLCAGSVAACSAPRHLIGVTSDKASSTTDAAIRSHKIFIVTTRAPSQEPGVFFSGQRSQRLSFATVDVNIPPNHVAGQVERPRTLPPDSERHFVIENPRTLELERFRKEAEAEVRGRPASKKEVLLWVHGYNTTLTDAVLRLAQFVEDTGYDGVPMLYSWASGGRLTSYVYDINSALIARDGLADVATALGRSSFNSIDIVAHSMGNFLMMETIRGKSRRDLYDTTGKLDSIILADPDIDYELFVSQLRDLPREKRRFYILISSDDNALRLSSFLARRPRVGNIDADKLSLLGVTVIDLTQVQDTSSVHHTKFVDSPQVVQLIGQRILAGDTSSQRGSSLLGETILVSAGGAIRVVE